MSAEAGGIAWVLASSLERLAPLAASLFWEATRPEGPAVTQERLKFTTHSAEMVGHKSPEGGNAPSAKRGTELQTLPFGVQSRATGPARLRPAGRPRQQ